MTNDRTIAMSRELAPCPFCYPHAACDEYPPYLTHEIKESKAWCVHAPCCDFYGPLSTTEEEATRKWNTRATPVVERQDEPISDDDLLAMADKAFGQVVDYDLRGGPITDYQILTIGSYGPAIRRLVSLARQHPASPPVLVAVVPDRELYTKYLRGMVPSNAKEVSDWKDGWNACLDKVKELNK